MSPWAALRTSPLRSSREDTTWGVQPFRSIPGGIGCSLYQSANHCIRVDFCNGFCVSKADVKPETMESKPSHASAIAESVCNAAVRMSAFWSVSTVHIGNVNIREYLSNGLPMPVAMRATISRASDCTALFVSVTLALRICPMSPGKRVR